MLLSNVAPCCECCAYKQYGFPFCRCCFVLPTRTTALWSAGLCGKRACLSTTSSSRSLLWVSSSTKNLRTGVSGLEEVWMRVVRQGLQSLITYLFVFQVFSASRSVPSICLHLRQQIDGFQEVVCSCYFHSIKDIFCFAVQPLFLLRAEQAEPSKGKNGTVCK